MADEVLGTGGLLNVVGSYLKLLKNKCDLTEPEVALSSSGSGDATTLCSFQSRNLPLVVVNTQRII
jgi:hypothetical protein